MCRECRNCGAKLVSLEKCPEALRKRLNPENDPYAYEYCCLCPNGCPDSEKQDDCELCCDCT